MVLPVQVNCSTNPGSRFLESGEFARFEFVYVCAEFSTSYAKLWNIGCTAKAFGTFTARPVS